MEEAEMRLTEYDKKPLADKRRRGKRGPERRPGGLLDLEARYGISRSTLRNRLRAGMTVEEAVSEPLKTRVECGQMAARARWGGTK